MLLVLLSKLFLQMILYGMFFEVIYIDAEYRYLTTR